MQLIWKVAHRKPFPWKGFWGSGNPPERVRGISEKCGPGEPAGED